jgi:sugar phosphate isomerase/epimerase
VKIAISCIAWKPEEEDEVARLLSRERIGGVEIVPGRVGPDPVSAPEKEILRYRDFWSEKGIPIVAMQALLFGKPELSLFGSEASRAELGDYLAAIVRLGGALGAKALVFGSPKNRLAGSLPPAEARRIAVAFFREMGAAAEETGSVLCIEHNPPEYGADFVTTPQAAADLVRAVDHPGFGLHVDGGGWTLSGTPLSVMKELRGRVSHFHASEPFLAPVDETGKTDHLGLARALRGIDYDGWVSIEMKPPSSDGNNLPGIERTLAYARASYLTV